ncbi:MAG TPA: amidohydrolase [Opitutaceae bacterium]|nr:amidohydrolase [Opitutaceae bacterium]
MYLVDTHQHLWDLARFPYSWCAGLPTLNRTYWLPEYKEASAGLNIAKTVFMECDVDEPNALGEARTIEALASQEPSIAGIVASGRPEHENFEAHLDALAECSRLRGVRRILHTQPDELSQSELFARNLRLLPARGLTFDLCVLARQLPLAIRLVERCPNVTFILDHVGVPDVKERQLDPWRENLARIATYPNVHCKISGLVAYADPARWTVDDLRPFVEHAIARFGFARVVWGGDWPVCTLSASLRQWVEATHQLFAKASEDERSALYHRNAEALYRV